MTTALTPTSITNIVRVGIELPSISIKTKTEFVSFDGKIVRSA
jgi:hypothetical protein